MSWPAWLRRRAGAPGEASACCSDGSDGVGGMAAVSGFRLAVSDLGSIEGSICLHVASIDRPVASASNGLERTDRAEIWRTSLGPQQPPRLSHLGRPSIPNRSIRGLACPKRASMKVQGLETAPESRVCVDGPSPTRKRRPVPMTNRMPSSPSPIHHLRVILRCSIWPGAPSIGAGAGHTARIRPFKDRPRSSDPLRSPFSSIDRTPSNHNTPVLLGYALTDFPTHMCTHSTGKLRTRTQNHDGQRPPHPARVQYHARPCARRGAFIDRPIDRMP